MQAAWQWFVAFLVSLTADQAAIDREAPQAAAAVAAARASMVSDAPAPAPSPAPTACDCGGRCVKGVWKPDGKIEQRCQCQCKRCVAERSKATPAPCPDGRCPPATR